MRKELPFKHVEEPSKFGGGAESDVFEFKPEKGKKYIYKEVRPWAADLYHGESLEEKALDMKRVHSVLKKHYRDKVADTYFIIGKNKKGEPCIIKIQKEIEGVRLIELKEGDPRYKRAHEQGREIRNNLSEVVLEIRKDSGLKDYSADKALSFVNDIDNSMNLIVDKKGNVTAIDW